MLQTIAHTRQNWGVFFATSAEDPLWSYSCPQISQSPSKQYSPDCLFEAASQNSSEYNEGELNPVKLFFCQKQLHLSAKRHSQRFSQIRLSASSESGTCRRSVYFASSFAYVFDIFASNLISRQTSLEASSQLVTLFVIDGCIKLATLHLVYSIFLLDQNEALFLVGLLSHTDLPLSPEPLCLFLCSWWAAYSAASSERLTILVNQSV